MRNDVGQDPLLGCVVGLRQLVGDGLDAAAAVAQLEHRDRDGIRREDPLRRQDQPAVARSIVAHLDVPRQPRHRRRAN